MRHRLFEEWLFSQDDLNSAQKELLDKHKQNCQHCQSLEAAWNEVTLYMDEQDWMAPDEDFGQRWRSRLKQYKVMEQQKHAYWAFLLTSGGALIFGIPFLISIFTTSPLLEMWSFFYRVSSLVETIQRWLSFLLMIFQPLGVLIPSALGIGIGFTVWGSMLLWLILMRRLHLIGSDKNGRE